MTTEQTTLEEVRAKTDQKLAVLIERRLHFAAACLLSKGQCRGEAENVYGLAAKIIPLIQSIPGTQRKHLEVLLREVGKLLAQTANYQETRAYAAC